MPSQLTGRPTDHKNINLAKLHRDVTRGQSGGMIIWQPRIQCWIDDKRYAGERLPEPFEGMSKPEIYRELGCSARIYEFNGCFRRIDDPRVKWYSRKISEFETEHIVETPVGKLTSITRQMKTTWAHLTEKRWAENEDDIRVLTWIEERCDYEWDEEHFRRTREEWGDLGAPTIFMPRVNIQHLYIDVMGVEKAVYALSDYPNTVEKYFRALDESHERLIRVINDSPIDIINFGDNVHAGALSPRLFKKYVLPAYQRRNELLHKAGKFTCAHWDGDTKPLLPFAKDTGLDGIEAITPKPQGDVTLMEVKEALGNMFLLDGIAAVLFDRVFDISELERQVRQVIELFAPRLILGISDEISSTGDIERIRLVGQIVDDYNASVCSHDEPAKEKRMDSACSSR